MLTLYVFYTKFYTTKSFYLFYREAGEHLIIALNQQAAGRGVQGEGFSPKAMSNTIWATLRIVITLMHKYHLTEAIENRYELLNTF